MTPNPFKADKTEDKHEFRPILSEIEDSPTSPLGRTVFWIVVAVFLFFVCWMFFGQMDVVVTAKGKVIPEGDVKVLQPLETGVVSKILVKNGDFVKKGQVLMEIDPSTTEPELESVKKNLAYVHLETDRLKATQAEQSFKPAVSGVPQDAIETQQKLHDAAISDLHKSLEAKEEDQKRLDSEIRSTEVEMGENQELLKTNLERQAQLKPVLDIIAKDEYRKVMDDIHTDRNKVQSLRYHLQELQHQKMGVVQEMASIRANFRKTTLQDLSDKQKQVTEQQAKADQLTFMHAKQRITAPVDGTIDNLQIHTVGGVVTPAEKLVSIVPTDTPLVIRTTMLSRDSGFVEVGMPVAIKIDTFDFQKYGMLKGRVKHVSKDSHEDQKLGPTYEVDIDPIEHSLVVDGKQQLITPGMSVNAEIKVGKRRIIEFFIYPLIKYLHEGISVR